MKSFFLSFIISFFSTIVFAQHHHTDRPSVHGMFMFGTEKIYLSHLPMFHSPHDYQVIFEVDLAKEVKEIYLKERRINSSQTVFTIVPEVFVLPDIVKSLKGFKASMFKGHFERGGVVITNEVEIKIKKVVYFNKFKKEAKHPDRLEYLLLGNENEAFILHLIKAKPDFDQIMEVDNSDFIKLITKETGIVKILVFDQQVQSPLINSSEYKIATFEGITSKIVGTLVTKDELYLEFDDLSF